MNAIVVDDERLAAEGLTRKLCAISCITKAHCFTDTDEALKYAEQNAVDIAFLDIELRRTSGLILAEKLRELRPDCAVIFVTGYPEYALDAFHIHAQGYLLKPVRTEAIERELSYLQRGFSRSKSGSRVRVQCFGNFEIFVDGLPLKFTRVQTKELLALLVDRRGAAMNTEQICAVLWQDSLDIAAQKNKLRHLVSDLARTLKAANANGIFLKRRNSFAIVVNSFDCDYYDLLHGIPAGMSAYSGEYMSQYSWAEMTLATLN